MWFMGAGCHSAVLLLLLWLSGQRQGWRRGLWPARRLLTPHASWHLVAARVALKTELSSRQNKPVGFHASDCMLKKRNTRNTKILKSPFESGANPHTHLLYIHQLCVLFITLAHIKRDAKFTSRFSDIKVCLQPVSELFRKLLHVQLQIWAL